MQRFSLLWLMLTLSVLAGCESLMYPGRDRAAQPAEVAPPVESPDSAMQCPEPAEVICAEPEVKVVERVIERTVEKVVEVPVAKDKLVLGSVEEVAIEPPGLILESVVDTGSPTSTLRVRKLTPFERDGRDWVRFQIVQSSKMDPVSVELPIKRHVRVERLGFDNQRRPVVELNLTVGRITHQVEVNLTDEGGSDLLMLLGRNFLKDAAVVDVSRRNVQGQPQIDGVK
ncbi:ATP-dependent zinc protease [Microbulbifer sp. JMSA004]|uniref:ATP-dependent zinc protease family protein n=1 Tax=unclassified Microbulbifer TaxID=2619833 RepID=UPI0024ACF0FC|nr:RimK/LysX family protein [Microbulbifer sp. VAAF005]WHI48515.1 RimK/LysX family protein [Microbulbifer sp. VAAF005]